MTSNGNGNNDSNSNSSKSPTALTSPAEPAVAAHSPGGPVIGVGASAGGLQALEEFFSQVQPDCGMAFVVVQHLDPDKQSLLAELLQRVSQLPVEQLAFSTPVEVNHVYVAPPAHDVELRQGLLHLLKPQVTRGKRLPIDFFLNSLAEDQQANAAGVILSGMGVDGTLGLRALKEKGGGVFVQSPDKAEFAGMPASAVDARLADVVAPAGELPARIADHFQNMLASNLAAGTQADLHAGIAKVLILVRTLTGHDFSYYKKSTVYRRIQRRMAIHQIQSLDEYARHIQLNPIEAQLLFKELLIGVTSFFRDPEVWRQLASQHIPELIRTHPDGAVLRAWVAACSTGEEAYTLAIIFAEVLAELRPQAHYSLQIFATDMDKDAIDKARLGQYSPSAVSELSEERLNRFFTKVPGGYQVRKDIRAMVIFAQQSIASDPPFARLDILCCRNLLIYLESDLQQKLLQLFHGSLNPGGLLVLGSAETVGQASALFSALGTKTRIYRRRGAGGRLGLGGLPRQSGFAGVSLAQAQILPTADPAGASLQGLADQLLLRKLFLGCPKSVQSGFGMGARFNSSQIGLMQGAKELARAR